MDWAQVAGDAASAAVSGAMGIAGSSLEYKYSKKLAEQQNQFNLDMWNRTNEYNSPQAQMQRFQEAGLNPNLIYGQGNSGNTTVPQMVTAEPPKLSDHMRRIGEAFNLENLRTVIANRKKAEADADNANTNAARNAAEFHSEKVLATKYSFNPSTGSFELRPDYKNGSTIIDPSAYYTNRSLAELYARLHLIPYRAAYLENQNNFLAPQIQMANYEAKYFPYSFWIGQGSKAIQGISSLIPKIPFSRRFTSSSGRVYRY